MYIVNLDVNWNFTQRTHENSLTCTWAQTHVALDKDIKLELLRPCGMRYFPPKCGTKKSYKYCRRSFGAFFQANCLQRLVSCLGKVTREKNVSGCNGTF